VMMYIRYPLSLRQLEDLLFERGIDICHETARFWWNRFSPMFAVEIRKRRVQNHSCSRWRWHLDEVFVRNNGETHYLWRAVDHEGEVLEVFVTKRPASIIPGGDEYHWKRHRPGKQSLVEQSG
jgi:putative transposase